MCDQDELWENMTERCVEIDITSKLCFDFGKYGIGDQSSFKNYDRKICRKDMPSNLWFEFGTIIWRPTWNSQIKQPLFLILNMVSVKIVEEA